MHVSGRRLVPILLASALVSSSLNAGPQPVPHAQLRAVEIDLASLAPLTRGVMRDELGVLLAPALLMLHWRTAATGEETDPDELCLVLLPRTGVGPDRGALGSTANRGLVRTIWVYVPTLATTLGLDPESIVTSPEAQRLMGVALGRVVAHEVVHALVPDLEHAVSGLMRPRLQANQLLHGRAALEGDCAASVAVAAQAWLATGARRPGARGDAADERSLVASHSDVSPEKNR